MTNDTNHGRPGHSFWASRQRRIAIALAASAAVIVIGSSVVARSEPETATAGLRRHTRNAEPATAPPVHATQDLPLQSGADDATTDPDLECGSGGESLPSSPSSWERQELQSDAATYSLAVPPGWTAVDLGIGDQGTLALEAPAGDVLIVLGVTPTYGEQVDADLVTQAFAQAGAEFEITETYPVTIAGYAGCSVTGEFEGWYGELDYAVVGDDLLTGLILAPSADRAEIQDARSLLASFDLALV